MKINKLFRLTILTLLLALSFSTTALADSSYSACWVTDASGNWKVKNSDGSYITSAWFCDDAVSGNNRDVWYLLDENGNMITAGLVQDGTGNYYSLETEHNGNFGMLRFKTGTYDGIYLQLESNHNGAFAAILNADGIEKLKTKYGLTTVSIDNSRCYYSSSILAVPGTKVAASNVDETGYWEHSYTDYYGRSRHKLSIDDFPIDAALYYKTLPRYQLADWEKYLTDEYNKSQCDEIAATLLESAEDEQEAVKLAIAFVQSLNYLSDGDGVEYPKYPIETLYDKGGDCEDSSILLCGIIRSLGFGSVLIALSDHCAVGILGDAGINGTYYDYYGERYYYVETTATGWKIGQIPNEYRYQSARLIGVR